VVSGKSGKSVSGEFCSLCCVVFLLIRVVVVVTVSFVCCSVILPLSPPTSFCLFLSFLLHTPVGGGAAEQVRGPFVAGHSQTITPSEQDKVGF